MDNKVFSNNYVYRLIFYFVGSIIIALGVSLTIISNFGTGAWDAVSAGMYNKLGLTVGTWVNIVAVFLVILSGIIMMKKPRIATLITSLIIGTFIDIWLTIFNNVNLNTTLFRFVTSAVGIVVISFGVAMYLVSNLPPSPIDYFMVCIKERFNISYSIAKIIAEGIGIGIALIVGGPIGLGTIIIFLFMGSIIDFFLIHTNKLYNILTKNKYF